MALSAIANPSPPKGALTWRPTKIMNMRDLSKDDDFLSHLLVEKLGTGTVPLLVHKMDPSRRLPKTDARDLLAIVQRVSLVLFRAFRVSLLLNTTCWHFREPHSLSPQKDLSSMSSVRLSTNYSCVSRHTCHHLNAR
jgi:hypothetical protein